MNKQIILNQSTFERFTPHPTSGAPTHVRGALDGVSALFLSQLAQYHRDETHSWRDILYIARDERRMAQMSDLLSLMAPDYPLIEFAPWDCMPYDRVSPHSDIIAKRMSSLARLALENPDRPRFIITSVSAIIQRVIPLEVIRNIHLSLKTKAKIGGATLLAFLQNNGYRRVDTVMEPGEYAVRGGIIDLFAPNESEPYRLDFFGDVLEQIRAFDPMSQRSSHHIDHLNLYSASEVLLNDQTIARFRQNYRSLFGVPTSEDSLYQALSESTPVLGMEHWQPLFYEKMDHLFDFCTRPLVILDHGCAPALEARWSLILEYYDQRRQIENKKSLQGDMIYHPIPPSKLFMELEEWQDVLARHPLVYLHSDTLPAPSSTDQIIDLQGKQSRDFGDVRALININIYAEVSAHIKEKQRGGVKVLITALSSSSAGRFLKVLEEHGLSCHLFENYWPSMQDFVGDKIPLIVLPLDHGFLWQDLYVLTEQDILGDRFAHPPRKKRHGHELITQATSLSIDDLVVHLEHGIGRYAGLVTLMINNAPHDCLSVVYFGGDKLFVPVENLEVLTRYGEDHDNIELDRLGSAAWQARAAKLKKRIRDIADQLVSVAALRQIRKAPIMAPLEGVWDEFCAKFPYAETNDQLQAIEDVITDLAKGQPMDRLICGDVGFGKTEIALRAAFVAALSGAQIALIVPTTLLARQHTLTLESRFAGLPLKIAQLSRMVSPSQAQKVKQGLSDGSIDIVIGTHALLAKSVSFKRLGLLIIDEEQHFGVAHKEALKQLKHDVHVLTLSATPIPRTLQMALSGMKDMSLIATPPIDRLAVRTFVLPYDPIMIREAILREQFRGGQVFYVCPRLIDIDQVIEKLGKLVPEAKIAIAHGRLTPNQLEDVMSAFVDKKYDILVSTNIIESGIDMPNVNTIIIHRADMFGLGQLYQLRGRVGRAKARGYAYLTVSNSKTLTKLADKRLHVMQTLDMLGAGFQLASHDLDIRGGGNLLGDEQSGHIKEVGIELYQQLLEQAVIAARNSKGGTEIPLPNEWIPQINAGIAVLIPDNYVKDLSLRLNLYRRIAVLHHKDDIISLRLEMIDRFGALPIEVENLFQIIELKALCKESGIEKVEAGPKGVVLSLYENKFANPEKLLQFIQSHHPLMKVRPDHKIVYNNEWSDDKRRMSGLDKVIRQIHALL